MKFLIPACMLLTLSNAIHAQEPQIAVSIRIAEFSLTKLRGAGIDISEITGHHSDQRPGDNAYNVFDGDGAIRKLDELRERGLVHILAEPTLVAANGTEVTFKSGGELPVRRPTANGGEQIRSQPSTLIKLTPALKDDHTTSLKFYCMLSKLADVQPPGAGKGAVPFATEKEIFSTQAELHNGQTLRLMGPKRISQQTLEERVPVLGAIPYVGSIFRKQKEVRNEIATLTLLRAEIITKPPTTVATGVSTAQHTPVTLASTRR